MLDITQKKIKGQIQVLAEHVDALTQKEASSLTMIFKRVQAQKQAFEEENDVLQQERFHHADLQDKRYRLHLLESLLQEYLHEKGLKQSMLKAEELQTMINRDAMRVRDELHDKVETIKGIQDVLADKKES